MHVMTSGDCPNVAAHVHAQSTKVRAALEDKAACRQVVYLQHQTGEARAGLQASNKRLDLVIPQSKRSLKQKGAPAEWGGLLTSRSQKAAGGQTWNHAGQGGMKEHKSTRPSSERGRQRADPLRATTDLSV